MLLSVPQNIDAPSSTSLPSELEDYTRFSMRQVITGWRRSSPSDPRDSILSWSLEPSRLSPLGSSIEGLQLRVYGSGVRLALMASFALKPRSTKSY